MNTARDAILARVRDALAARAESPAVARNYRHDGALDREARVDLFAARVADHRARIARVARERIACEIAKIASGLTFGVPEGLPHEWWPDSAVVDRSMSSAELDVLDGVVTGCTAAIAETGTIVLAGHPHEGRRALTLVPDLHVCVVEVDQIVGTVPEAIELLQGESTRPLTFISGPSATSDIELSRVEGVHGPRRLTVLVVE